MRCALAILEKRKFCDAWELALADLLFVVRRLAAEVDRLQAHSTDSIALNEAFDNIQQTLVPVP
jgi:hypothetical protein